MWGNLYSLLLYSFPLWFLLLLLFLLLVLFFLLLLVYCQFPWPKGYLTVTVECFSTAVFYKVDILYLRYLKTPTTTNQKLTLTSTKLFMSITNHLWKLHCLKQCFQSQHLLETPAFCSWFVIVCVVCNLVCRWHCFLKIITYRHKYFWLCRPGGLCHNYLTLPL